MFDNLKGDLVFSVCLYEIVASLGFFSSTGKTEEKALKSTVFFEINKAFFKKKNDAQRNICCSAVLSFVMLTSIVRDWISTQMLTDM